MSSEWFEASPASAWEDDFTRLTDEWRQVEWQSGGRTLLAAMGLQNDEVKLCRGLAWLLDPLGGHRLDRLPLNALLQDLDLAAEGDAPVKIVVEESRDRTRADIVLRVGGETVVIEAKVRAGEQGEQADRLSDQWANEEPTLVFLTPTGRFPYTATKSSEQWVALTWRGVARLIRNAADEAGIEPSAGAREYLETIGAL